MKTINIKLTDSGLNIVRECELIYRKEPAFFIEKVLKNYIHCLTKPGINLFCKEKFQGEYVGKNELNLSFSSSNYESVSNAISVIQGSVYSNYQIETPAEDVITNACLFFWGCGSG